MIVGPTFLRQRRRLVCSLLALCSFAGLLALPPRAGAPLLQRGASALPPEITLTITGTLGLDGWYRSDVTIDWQVVGETSSSGCDTVTLTADTPGTKFTCSAQSGPDETVKSVTIKLDKTAPSATATADRAPDANGWYNHPLTVTSSGTDGLSGMGACSSAGYSGPDNAGAVVKGTCTDHRRQHGADLALDQVRRDRPLALPPGHQTAESGDRARVEEGKRHARRRDRAHAGSKRCRRDPGLSRSRDPVHRQGTGRRPRVRLPRDRSSIRRGTGPRRRSTPWRPERS